MKDRRIEVRVSEPEYVMIKENAEKENVTISEYLRNQAINGNGQKESPKLLCDIASLLQETEDKFKNNEDRDILREAGKRLWNL